MFTIEDGQVYLGLKSYVRLWPWWLKPIPSLSWQGELDRVLV